jgi:hypothetical protein
MIAGEDQHVTGTVRPDNVQVLVNSVGRPPIPLTANALGRREDFDELAGACLEPGPPMDEVPDQRMRLVLGQYGHTTHAGVQAVRKREVYDPVLAAEIQRRFGTPVRQLVKA